MSKYQYKIEIVHLILFPALLKQKIRRKNNIIDVLLMIKIINAMVDGFFLVDDMVDAMVDGMVDAMVDDMADAMVDDMADDMVDDMVDDFFLVSEKVLNDFLFQLRIHRLLLPNLIDLQQLKISLKIIIIFFQYFLILNRL